MEVRHNIRLTTKTLSTQGIIIYLNYNKIKIFNILPLCSLCLCGEN